MSVLDAAMRAAWAIHEPALQTILEVAARQDVTPDNLRAWKAETSDLPGWQALAVRSGSRPPQTDYLEIRDGIAVVQVRGPIFRYANLFTELSGATALSVLTRDFHRAAEDPMVRAILLAVDSPGGEATDIAEFAAMVRETHETRKPVTAYVGGVGASAAYWIAAAAGEVVVSDTALLGSIGVVSTWRDSSAREAAAGIKTYEIVSSQSPQKRLDPATDEGRGAIQALVDRLATEFIAAVARYRGVGEEKVMADFGKGGLVVGVDAVAAGMADRSGSFEKTLAALSQSHAPSPYSPPRATAARLHGPDKEDPTMADTKPAAQSPAETKKEPATAAPQQPSASSAQAAAAAPAVQASPVVADASAVERQRCGDIVALPEAKGREQLANHLAFRTAVSVDEAKAILAAAPATASAHAQGPTPFEQAMAGLANPRIGVDGADTDGKDSPDAVAKTAVAAARQAGMIR